MTTDFKTNCLRIMELAMETPPEKAHIICGWVAHCDHFEVRVFLGGWKMNSKPDLSVESHDIAAKGYTPDFHVEPIDVLNRIKALLA